MRTSNATINTAATSMTIILFFLKGEIIFDSFQVMHQVLKNSQSNDLEFKSDFIFSSFSKNAFIVSIGLNFRQKV
jgi:hypothetical protein